VLLTHQRSNVYQFWDGHLEIPKPGPFPLILPTLKPNPLILLLELRLVPAMLNLDLLPLSPLCSALRQILSTTLYAM